MERILYQSDRLTLVERDLPRADGGTTARAFIRHPGSVVILPVLDDGRIVLIRNRRHAVGHTLWELPAGTLHMDEPFDCCAARELEEETGYASATLEPLLSFYAAPGSSDERMHAFVARDLRPTRQQLDPTEQIAVHVVEEAEVRAMVRDGRIEDAKSLCTLLFWWASPTTKPQPT
jgi:ADP-ribose pyrophosphatase